MPGFCRVSSSKKLLARIGQKLLFTKSVGKFYVVQDQIQVFSVICVAYTFEPLVGVEFGDVIVPQPHCFVIFSGHGTHILIFLVQLTE